MRGARARDAHDCTLTSDRRLLFHFRRPCPPRPSGRAESDARYGGFDFRAAHAEADADLRELLDNTESLPFRRRGYERDGMLRTVVARAGFAQLYESAQQAQQQRQKALEQQEPERKARSEVEMLYGLIYGSERLS